MHTDQNTTATGPLRFPAPPDAAASRALTEALKGHTTSDAWLPAGVFPALDEVRDEHLRLRRQVAADLEALNALSEQHRQEDAEHQEALRQSYRDGAAASEDRRTPPEQRAAARAAIEERLWVGVAVWAEHIETVLETTREHEDRWLAELQSQLVPAQEKRREAARLLAEAQAEEYRVLTLGKWLQTLNDDGPFGRQPAPVAGMPRPANLDPQVLRDALTRPWHKARPWSAASAEAVA